MEIEFESLQKLGLKENEFKRREENIQDQNEKQIQMAEEKCQKLLDKQSEALKKKYLREVQTIYDEMKQKFQKLQRIEKQELAKEYGEKIKGLGLKIDKLEHENTKLRY